MKVTTAAPAASTIPHVSALSPQGSDSESAFWQEVDPLLDETHSAGHNISKTRRAAAQGATVRTKFLNREEV